MEIKLVEGNPCNPASERDQPLPVGSFGSQGAYPYIPPADISSQQHPPPQGYGYQQPPPGGQAYPAGYQLTPQGFLPYQQVTPDYPYQQPYPVKADHQHSHHDSKSKEDLMCGSITLLTIGGIYAFYFILFLILEGAVGSIFIPTLYILAGILGIVGEGKVGVIISIIAQFLLLIFNFFIVALTLLEMLITIYVENLISLGIIFFIFGALFISGIFIVITFIRYAAS